MRVATSHINNVLRAYSKQLSLSKRTAQKSGALAPEEADTISISAKARRKAVVERVTADIVERIVHDGPREGLEQEVFKQLEDEYGKNLALKEDSSTLAFKVINKEEGEEIITLSTEDSKFLRDRLVEITRKKVDSDMLG